MIECRGQRFPIEVTVVDDDLIDPVDAPQAQRLGQRKQRAIAEARIAGGSQDKPLHFAVIEGAFHFGGRPKGWAEVPKGGRRRQQLLIGGRIQGTVRVFLIEWGSVVQSNDLDPDTIPELGLPYQLGDRACDGLGALRESARARDQQTEENQANKRALRHRVQISSVLALLLVIGVGCSQKVARDPEAFVVVLPRDAEQLDPRFVADPYGLRVSRLLFASLVTIDPRTLEVVPDLAESVVASSPTEYEVRLREKLRFSDGRPLDAEDVAATFRGVVDPELESRYAHTYRRIQSIEIVDPHTLRFVLREPHATFLTDLELPIVRRVDAHHRIATEQDPFPVGAGPYRLVGRSPGVLELRANAHWHRGRPRIPSLRLVVIRDDNTRALRMLAGQGDLAIGSIPPLLLPMFRDDPSFETPSAPGVSTMYLGFHTASPKLRDVRVRQAVGAAIDRQLLVETKYDGLARIADSWIPFGHWAHLDSLKTQPFDPERARELLDLAGFADPPGPDPRMRLILRTTSDRSRQSVARAIAAMLREVGIEVDVRPSEAATLIADLNQGRFELTLLQVPEVLEPHVLSWFFDSSRIPGPDREGANRWRYRNPELDRLFELGRTRINRAERRAAYEQVQQILARDIPVLPLWQPDTVAVVRHGTDFDVPRDGRFGTLAF